MPASRRKGELAHWGAAVSALPEVHFFLALQRLWALVLTTLVVAGGLIVAPANAQGVDSNIPTKIDCDVHECRRVFPTAAAFREQSDKPYLLALDEAGETIGWLVLSTDFVEIKGYSGKPLVTLVGLDRNGIITGARVVNHAEPILLVGIPEKKLHDFVDFYRNKPATEKVVVGTADDGVTSVDAISGATVTALAQNQTILETAVALGIGVGAISAQEITPGRFVRGREAWSWTRMWEEGAIGRLYVSNDEMGLKGKDGAFIDLLFTVADAPHVGMGLLGPSEYEWYMSELEKGEHLLIVLGNGSSSFKGSGFVRGGIFDRIRPEQGMKTVLFTDKDYKPLARAHASDAPSFNEGAVFIVRNGSLDPGQPFDLVFLGSVYNRDGGFGRDFRTFSQTFRLPQTVYEVQESENAPMWKQAWRNNRVKVWLLGAALLVLVGLFSARRWLTGGQRRLRVVHVSFMTLAFLGIGLGLGVQPSVTQIFTVIDGALGQWRWDLFLSEPLVFIFWIFILVVAVIWGRGVFCGWACPYGAMNELAFLVGKRLGIKKHFEFSDAVHAKAKYLRYVVLAVLVATYVYRPELGERMAEIEPFKSTFYVAPWTREVGYFAWWLLLIGAAFVWWRPFCRYLCPLGAGLAILGGFRFSGPYRRKGCDTCKICTTTCEPRAIDAKGRIDPRECLSCMECEANFRDRDVCPPLIGIDRLLRKPDTARTEADERKLVHLREQEQRR